MSKLSDRIRRAGKTEPAPMGFAAAAAKAAAPSLLVIAKLDDSGKIAEAVDKGADAVLVEMDAARLRSAKAPDDAIIGVVAKKADRKEASALREAGADFLVVDEDSDAGAMLDEKLGFVMAVSTRDEDTRLKVTGDLTLDALLVAAPEPPMTVGRVLDLRRVAGMGRAPLLVEIDADADAGVLQLLRESGAIGVVVAGAGKVAELKERIASMPVRGKRPEEHGGDQPLVPASTSAGSHNHDDDDDYDD